MKRVKFCLIILAIIIISSITMVFVLKSYNEKLTEKIDDALSSWQQQDYAKATEKVDDLCEFWNKYNARLSCIIRRDKLDHISMSVAKLKPLIESRNDEFLSECESIKFSVEMIFDCELPKLHSIL